MPKFMKQVRNFLNNSPFKMYNKPAPLKVKGAYVKKGGKATVNIKDYAIGSKSRYNEYESRGWKQDATTKGGAPKPTTVTAPATAPATASQTRNANSIGGNIGRDNSADAITRRAQASQNKKDLAPTGERAATKPPETVKKVTKEELAANAKIAKNKKIAAKAKAAMDKKKAAADGQKQNMKDKNKLKAEIKDKRKSTTRKERKKDVKYQDKDTGKNVSAQDQLKAKRKEKRVKSKAIRKYKNNPDNMKVAKVKKEKKSKVNARTPSGNSGQAFVGEKPKKPSAVKMYKKKK
jgi:hypothetical protein